MNLVQLFDKNLVNLGEKRELVFEGEAFTNRQINESGRKLANGLRQLDYTREDHIAVCLPNRVEVLAVFQAIWRIGAVCVPIMFRMQAAEARYILNHSDATAVITSIDLLPMIKEASASIDRIRHVIALGQGPSKGCIRLDDLLAGASTDTVTEDMDGNDLAQIIYTSGTTGKPKGVMQTHANLMSNAASVWGAWGFKEPAVALLCLPLAHSFGVSVLTSLALSPFDDGFEVLMRWFEAETVFKLIEKYKVTYLAGVPTMFQVMVNHSDREKYDLSSLSHCDVGGATVTQALLEQFYKTFGCQLCEGYGLTEASPGVTATRSFQRAKPGSCGLPNPGVSVQVVGPAGQKLATGETGEIVVKGKNIMKGYYKQPEETKKVLINGWLHTGDVGHMDKDGYLFITDRIKDMIIKGGYNIYPKEIEDVLEKHPAVAAAAVTGTPHDRYGEDVIAFVVLKAGTDASESDIMAHAHTLLTKFKCPSRIYWVDEFPRTLSGKVQKTALQKSIL